MTDIIITPIPEEITRIEDADRVFETFKNTSKQIEHKFSDLVWCELSDSTNQSISAGTGTYTYQSMSQSGGFDYTSGTLTVPKTSLYYISHTCTGGPGPFPADTSFTLGSGLLLCDIVMGRPTYFSLNYTENNTNLVRLEKGQTITFTRTLTGTTSSLKSAIRIVEISPLAVIIK